MGRKLGKFLAGTSRPLQLASVAFCIAGLGVALGFLGFTLQQRLVGLIAFGITAAGVVLGGAAIVWGWIDFLRRHP